MWYSLLTVLYFASCDCARILAVVPTPSYSHQLAFRPIWEKLILRGHHVTLMTTDPFETTLENLTQISWKSAYKPYDEVFSKVVHAKNFFKGFLMGVEMIHKIVDKELSHPKVKDILENKNVVFDLVMIEYSYPAMFAFRTKFNCTFIGLSSFDVPLFGHEAVGDSINPVLYPDYLMPFLRPRNLFERVYSTAYYVFIKTYNLLILDHIHQKNVNKHFGVNYPSISALIASVDMLFINVNPIFHNIRPVMPNVIQFGGSRELNRKQPLEKNMEEFIGRSKNGFIYFNLGTNVKSGLLPDELKRIFLKVFEQLPYQILWKYEGQSLPNIPANVKFQKWFPQQDLLRHSKIRLFITQGGIQSIEEAVMSEVPMLAIPFFGDQFANAQKMHEMGFGYYLNSRYITENYLKQIICEVIENPMYRRRIKEMSILVKDVPLPGIQNVIWWTEYALRHKNLSHLQSSSLPLYQFYLIDVISFILSVICAVFLILRFFVKYVVPKLGFEKRKWIGILLAISISVMLTSRNNKNIKPFQFNAKDTLRHT